MDFPCCISIIEEHCCAIINGSTSQLIINQHVSSLPFDGRCKRSSFFNISHLPKATWSGLNKNALSPQKQMHQIWLLQKKQMDKRWWEKRCMKDTLREEDVKIHSWERYASKYKAETTGWSPPHWRGLQHKEPVKRPKRKLWIIFDTQGEEITWFENNDLP